MLFILSYGSDFMFIENHFRLDKLFILERLALSKFMGVIGGVFYLLNVRLIYNNTISRYTVNFKLNILILGILRFITSLSFVLSEVIIFYFLDSFFRGYMFMVILLHIAVLYRYYSNRFFYWGLIITVLSCSSIQWNNNIN